MHDLFSGYMQRRRSSDRKGFFIWQKEAWEGTQLGWSRR